VSNSNVLFSPLQLGDLLLPNRIIMAPLTRCRASPGRVPNDLMREYYTQRSSAGLILTEATAVTEAGVGYIDTPGIWSDAQVAGWKAITDSVHAAGGRIFCQLWHVGRLSHPDFLNGELPIAPSPIAAAGELRVPTGHKPYPIPREATHAEITETIAQYKRGAMNAKRAGFDGVEIHGANGYLPDQFLRDGANHRTDEYGGSIENRARFLLAVTDAAIGVWGAGRVGVHLSPRALAHHSIDDSDPANTFGYLADKLGERRIAFIFTRESVHGGVRYSPEIKRRFGGNLIANEQLTPAQAAELISSGEADAACWGQLFIANPDLPRRLELNAPLNQPNPKTYYAQGAVGYTDYPFLEE
jgi:2,4-dienoyl-CoA reductase-like NADH-dependent reductase (Old Yellow Enzyme family)